jgi:CRISPR/Cas system Type II protein with McrA/HNH and RuvC-like nuclease domain
MTGKQKNLGALTFGFDIGIASVGWAVLGEHRIVDLGVRCFDAAEDPEDGTPYNQKRRGGRVARNRLHTRAWRLKRLRRLLRDAGLISSADFQNLNQKPRQKGADDTSPWTLRSKALTEKLNPDDWARVIYHLVKHRGFGILSQSELEIDPDAPVNNDETAGLMDGLRRNSALLRKHKTSLKTLGNIAVRLPKLEPDSEDGQSFRLSIRNKGKSYRHAFLRADLRDELETLFIEQERLGNLFIIVAIPEDKAPFKLVHVGGEKKEVPLTFKDQVFALFDMQKPPISTEQMKGLIGDCEFEKGEKRAPRNSFSNERSTWLQKLNSIKVRRDGKETFLTLEERLAVINLPYKNEKITYSDIRDALCQARGFSRVWREASFNMLSYRPKIKADAGWINIMQEGNKQIALNKYNNFSDKNQAKEAKKKLKDTLLNSTITYAELRTLFNVPAHCVFQHAHKEHELIQKELEATHAIPFSAGNSEYILRDGITYKINLQRSNESNKLSKKSFALLAELKTTKPDATLADLRVIVGHAESINEPWLFEFNQTARVGISPSIEAETRVPIEYENMQSIEDSTCIELKGWHKLRKALAQQCPVFWQSLTVAYQKPTSKEGQDTASKLDEVARTLAIYQTDFERRRELDLMGIKEEIVTELLKINLTGFRNLSIKALRKILPFLEEGDVFSKACEQAGYNHSQRPAQQRKTTLDPFETYQFERWRSRNDGGKALMSKQETRYKDLNNPTVARALNQARRVLNDLVEKYGSPAYINVELARDLSRSKRLRDKIKNEQDSRRDDRIKADAIIRETFRDKYGINDPTSTQILKVRLYEEQNQKCAYSYPERGLDIRLILSDEDCVQIDHIWPKSSTFDNSLNNRVLVLAGANQNKGDNIPYDYFGKQNSAHWQHFQAWVNSCKSMPKEKQDRLLAKELDADEFAARNLVDTRYVTKLLARILRERLIFAGGATEDFNEIGNDEAGKEKLEKFYRSRVRTPQGGAIAFLRRCWGLQKNREESDLHHALDACVIAATSPSLIKQVNDFNRREEQFPYRYKKNDDGKFTDTKTGEVLTKDEALEAGVFFPKPTGHPHFREEVLARLSSDGRTYQTKKGERKIYDFANYSQDEISQVKPLLVSRLVKKKRNVELHDANPMGLRYYPVRLIDLTPEMLDEALLLPFLPEKKKNLIAEIRTQLGANNGNATIAFAGGFLTKNAKDKAVVIHTVALPVASLPKTYLGKQNENFKDTTTKNVFLSNLSLKMLSEKELGATFYNRNKRLIEALKAKLTKFDDDAEKAFSKPFYPFGTDNNRPFIRSIRIPAPRSSGIYVRGGVANLGDALYTEVYKHEGIYWFRARYRISEEKTFGLPVMPNGAEFICNFTKNEYVRIKHSNLLHCYRELSRYTDSFGNILISAKAIFDDGVFEGYWNYFEPSNDRPVVQLHDGRKFFLLEDGKTIDKKTLTLIAKPKEKKKAKGQEELEYFEYSESPQEKSLKFSLVSDIKRKVNDATFIEKVKVDTLGYIQEK